ncbi:hypothetical protein [Saccharospirillum mangrovi]|uniref:hypothetical protein n=1 Tax=Saccharospirillum mangrovi TaxID=2161747 RepID=UPI000D37295D|nr:hypothetical protein [Saccharospirillum mangrovi]
MPNFSIPGFVVCVSLFCTCLAVHAESLYEPSPVPAFPAPAQLELQFDASDRVVFSWQPVPNATLYHLQEQRDNHDHFLDLAANLPASTQRYRILPALYGRHTSHYRLLSCNAAGCSQSNTLMIRTNPETPLADLMPPQRSDLFGSALSLNEDGTILAVGAPTANVRNIKTGMGAGAVYVFQHHQGNWSAPATLVSATDSAVERFGYAVKIDAEGRVLSIDSQAKSNNNGRAITQVFAHKTAGGWYPELDSNQYDSAQNDQPILPISLSTDGNVLAITIRYEFASLSPTSPWNDTAFNTGTLSSVYLFDQTRLGWAPPVQVTSATPQPNGLFGYAISLSGNSRVLAVGEPVFTDAANQAAYSGAVYIFERQNSGHWQQQAYLHSHVAMVDPWFGHSLSLNGDGTVLAVGTFDRLSASNATTTGLPRLGTGQVQVFTRTASTDWQFNTRLEADSHRTVQAAWQPPSDAGLALNTPAP